MPDNATRAEKPTADPAQPTEDPPAPTVESVRTRGGSVGQPRKIAIAVTHWPRGEPGPVETTVTFSVRGSTATLTDVDGDNRLAHHLGAVAVAEDHVEAHPAVAGVAGLTAVSRSERTHVERCQARADDPDTAEARPDGGHPAGRSRRGAPTGDHPSTDADTTTTQSPQWRLRYAVGELGHYTEWTSDFAAVENLYEQYRRGTYGHDIAIERRTEVETE